MVKIVLTLMLLAIPLWSRVGVPLLTFAPVDSMEHPTHRFTQGWWWTGDTLVESTGLVGQSWLVRSRKGTVPIDSIALAAPHFGEGSSRHGNEIFWLTWKSGKGFVYDARTLAPRGEFALPGEGWGMAPYKDRLLISNGSGELWSLSPSSRSLSGSIRVPGVTYLNELEVVGDVLLANVWTSDSILVVQLPTGKPCGWLDLTQLSRSVRKKYPRAEVLNGLAWDGKHIWVTGKWWPKSFALDIKDWKGCASGIQGQQSQTSPALNHR